MADDNNSRYRPTDPFGRRPASTQPASDPLAELARLIGQSDPFAEFGHNAQQPAPRDAGSRYPSEPAPHFSNSPTAPYHDEPQAYGHDQAHAYGHDSAPAYSADHAPHFEPPVTNDWPGEAAAPATHPYVPADAFSLPLPRAPERHVNAQNFADVHAAHGAESYRPEHSDAAPASDVPAPEAYPSAPEPAPLPQALYPHEPEEGSMPPPHDDEFYNDAPRSARRKGLLTVAAVLGLAVIGTAGAFGYRSFFGGHGSSSPPPVIRASNAPSKVAPPPSRTDQATSKFSYDRFSDRGKNEQVVVREEKPVDTKDLARSSVARSTPPGIPITGMPTAEAANATATANPPSALGEPRRVRTVPIRPSGPDTGANIAAMPQTAAPTPTPPTRPARVANAAPTASPPTHTAPVVHEPPAKPPVAARASSSRNASHTRSRAVAPPPAPAVNAPLSLSPNSNYALPPPAQASAPPPRASSAPTRLASAPTRHSSAPAGGGHYLVQVSSQRSEADAQASFRSIQAKYSSVLGGRSHVVRRANLGSRGIYYRAMVGPFGTRAEAIKLCSSLKAAGGDCVVQTN
jgi:hypothetical protein